MWLRFRGFWLRRLPARFWSRHLLLQRSWTRGFPGENRGLREVVCVCVCGGGGGGGGDNMMKYA